MTHGLIGYADYIKGAAKNHSRNICPILFFLHDNLPTPQPMRLKTI